ncbi:MAG: hypothetical protein ACYTEU_12245 [Planctomycetota bacterium]
MASFGKEWRGKARQGKMKPFKPFQIRWKEPLGRPECPYLYRWTFLFFNYSIRIHHWLRSDDNRYFHDHACDLISIILKGYYYNVVPDDPDNPNVRYCRKIRARAFRPWKAKATAKHYLQIPKAGAWTLLLQGRPYHKWGFYVDGRKLRPLRYFQKFGIIQDENYQ